jgi:hypothetical protein
MSDHGAAATLGAQVPVPTWAILLVTMALGPGDTIAASFIAAPEAAHLAAQVADLSDTVADLSDKVEALQERDAELMRVLLQKLDE